MVSKTSKKQQFSRQNLQRTNGQNCDFLKITLFKNCVYNEDWDLMEVFLNLIKLKFFVKMIGIEIPKIDLKIESKVPSKNHKKKRKWNHFNIQLCLTYGPIWSTCEVVPNM